MTHSTSTPDLSPTGALRQPIAIERDGGERLEFLGALILKLSDPAEPLGFYEYTSQPSVAGAPQHVHHGHDETFYVARGTYEFAVGADIFVYGEGGFVSVPAGTPHAFRNCGDTEGRLVGTFSPTRYAGYFRELAEVIRSTGAPPGYDDWVELYARYDTAFHEPVSRE